MVLAFEELAFHDRVIEVLGELWNYLEDMWVEHDVAGLYGYTGSVCCGVGSCVCLMLEHIIH